MLPTQINIVCLVPYMYSIGNHTVFLFNVELICLSEIFKKLKLREPLWRVYM